MKNLYYLLISALFISKTFGQTTPVCQPTITNACTPFFSGGPAAYYINSFTLNAIVANSSCAAPPNTDNTTFISANLVAGTAYNFTVNTFVFFPMGGGMGVGIWMDTNDDGDFTDVNEELYSSFTSTFNFSILGSITIPMGTPSGKHTLRVIAHDIPSAPTDPCGNYGTAEVEDYVVQITNAGCVASVSSNSPMCEGNTLNINSVAAASYSWEGPNSFTSDVQNPTIANVTSAASGVYTLIVTDGIGGTCTATSNVTIYNQAVCTGLIGHYKLDGNANDESENNLHGTINGTLSPTTDRFGNPTGAMHFNGNIANYISINDHSLLHPNNVTVASWFKTSDINSFQNILTKVYGNCVGSSWLLDINQGGVLSATSMDECNGYSLLSHSPISPNQWTHIAQVIDTDLDIIKLYVNGNMVTSTPFTGNIFYDNNPVFFGVDKDNGNFWAALNGDLDEVRIYGSAFTDQQVLDLYNETPCEAFILTNTTSLCEGSTLELSAPPTFTYSWTGPNGFTSTDQNPVITNITTNAGGVYTLSITNGVSCTVSSSTAITVYSSSACTGLIGHYKLDGNANDESGNNLHGIINGTLSPTTDRFGNPTGAMSFDANVNNHIVVTDHPLLRPKNITLSTWVKTNLSGFQSFVGKVFGTCIGNSWQLGFDGSNLNAWVATGACSVPSLQYSPIPQNTWMHLVEVIDTDNDLIKLYFNGNLIASGSFTDNILYDDKSIYFGMDIDNGNMFGALNGALDDVRIYGSVLSDTEILDLYQSEGCVPPTISSNSPLCSDNTLNLSSTLATSYSWEGPNGFLSSSQSPSIENITNLASGIYTITVLNGTCTATATVNVEINNSPNSPTITGETEVCYMQTTQLVADCPTNTTVKWYNQNGNFLNTGTNFTTFPITGNGSTITNLYIAYCDDDISGCRSQGTSIEVTLKPTDTPTASSNSPVCVDGILNFSSTGGIAYEWSGPNSFSSTLQNPTIENIAFTAGGAYTVTVTATNGCTTTTETSVIINSCNTTQAGALSFDGIDDKVELGNWFEYQNFSIEMWINPAEQQTTWANVLDNNHVGTTNIIWQQVENTPNYYVFGATSKEVHFTLTPNTWQHVAIVQDDKSLKAYINGVLIDEENNNGLINYSTASLRLGAWGSGGRHWKGAINEFRIWDRPISQEQIQANMNCELVGIPSNLQAYYKFNQGFANADNSSQTTLIDATTNHAGTLNNFALNANISNFIEGVFEQACIFNIAAYKPIVCAGESTNLYALNCVGDVSWVDDPTGISRLNIIPTITYSASCIEGANLPVNSNSLTITINSLPTINITGATVCVGETVQLTATDGNTFSWSGPDGFASTSQNPTIDNVTTTAKGTYTVTVTNENGCTNTATTELIINPLPVIIASSNSPVCIESTLNLSSSGGSSYAWAGPNSFTSTEQNPSISSAIVSSSGTYTVTVTNANSCVSTAAVSVVVNPLPTIVSGSNSPICAGGTLNLTASGGSSYTWSGPNSFTSSSQNPSMSAATVARSGTYTVTVTNANSCVSTAAVSVVVNPLPTIVSGSNSPICAGANLNLTASGGSSYAWAGPNSFTSSSQNSSISAATVSRSGTYTVTVTNANSCVSTAAVSVVVNPLPTIVSGSNSPICAGANLNLTASGGSSYAWAGPNSFTSSSQNPSMSAATVARSGTYTVTVTNANSCISAAAVSVVVNPLPTIISGSNSPICAGANLNLTASGGSSYAWVGPNSFTSSSQNPSIVATTVAHSGTYAVTVTNANSCVSTAAVSVVVNPLPTIISGSNSPICVGGTLNLTSSGGSSYVWSGPNSFTSSSQNPSIVAATVARSGTYTVTVTNANSCVSTAAVSVVVNPLPTIISGSNSPICAGANLNLTASGGSSYAWAGPNSFTSSSQNPSIVAATVAHSGTYTVIVTNANSCVSTAQVVVVVNQKPTPTVSSFNLCSDGFGIVLSATGGNSYVWNGPNGYLRSGAYVNAAGYGTYTVTVTNTVGCTATATINLTMPIPSSNSPTIAPAQTATLNGSGCVSYQWYNQESGGTLLSNAQSFTTPGLTTSTIYYLQCGCPSSNRVPVTVVVSNGPCESNTAALGVLSGVHVKTASQTITSGNPLQIQPGANVTLSAGKSVILLPNFKTENGAIFKAEIGGCN